MPAIDKPANARRPAVAALPGVRLQGAETDASMGVGRLEAEAGTRLAASRAAAQGTAVGIDIFAQQQLQRRKEIAKEKQDADETAVMAAQNVMNKHRRDRVHGPDGTMSKHGKDSFGEPEAVSAEFETLAGETMKGLATPEQRHMFEKWLVGERDSINLAVLDHTNREITAYKANELDANTTNAVDLSIRENMLDVRQGAVKLQDAEDNLRRIGPQIGLTDAQIEAQVRSMRTQSVEGTVRGMIAAGRVQDAKAFFLGDGTKENPGTQSTIDQKRVADIKDALNKGSVRKEAQQELARILTATSDFEKQRQMAKDIKDSDVSDETLQRVEHEHTVAEAQKVEAKRTFMLGVGNKVDRERSIEGLKKDGSWEKLDSGEKSAMINYVENLVQFKDMNVSRTAYLEEIRQANENPLKWASKTTFPSRINEFQRADMNHLISVQQSILNGERNKAQTSIDGVLTNIGVINNVLSSAGIRPDSDKDSAEQKLYDDMIGAIDKEVQRQQTHSGKKLSNDEIRKIADQFTIEAVLTPGSGDWTDTFNWWSEKNYGDTKGRMGIAISQIPEDMRTQIEQSLDNANPKKEKSYENILKAWLDYNRLKTGTKPKQSAPPGPLPSAPRTTGGVK